ncbi:MAG: hypothetical protein AAF788_06665 [Pseudomonadota bacterium]
MTTTWLMGKVATALGLGAALFVTFTVLITLVFMIPNDPIAENLGDKIDALDDTYGINGRIMDSGTECIGVSVGLYQDPQHENQSTFWKAINATSLYGCQPLIDWLETGEPQTTRDYFRYWHGYLLVFRPFMAALPYHDVRGFMFLISVLLTSAWLLRLGQDFGLKVAMAFAVPLLFVNTIGLVSVVTKAVTWWLVVGGGLYLTRLRSQATQPPVLTFFVLGCLTAFFDFLTTPMLILVVPFMVFCLYNVQSSAGLIANHPLKTFSLCTVFFGAGWIGLWASKIILAAAVIGPEVITNSLGAAAFRVRGEAAGIDNFWLGQALYTNLAALKVFWGPATLITFGIIPFIKQCGRDEALTLWKKGRILIIAALVPLAFLEVLSNHAQIHEAFTHVNIYPALVLLGLILLRQTSNVLAAKTEAKAENMSGTER